MGLLRRIWCRWFHDKIVTWDADTIYTVCSTCGTRTEGVPLGPSALKKIRPTTKPFWYRSSRRKYVRLKNAKHPIPKQAATIYLLESKKTRRG